MDVRRLNLLVGPNRYSDVHCLEAIVVPPRGSLGWLGRARASLARVFPELLPRPAARTFLPRAAAADLLARVTREIQRRAGAEPPPVHIPPKITTLGWQVVVPFEDALVGEASFRAAADLVGSYSRG